MSLRKITPVSIIVLLSLLPSAVFAEEPTIMLKPLPKVCYELGSAMVLEGEYPAGAFSDFAIWASSSLSKAWATATS